MSSPSVCEFPGCEGNLEARGLCRTHRRDLEEEGSLEVQAFVDERERQADIALAGELDWEYLTDAQAKAIERGVDDAYYDNTSHLNWHDWQNLKQEMTIWAAGHRAEVQKFTSMRKLREHIKRRSIELHKTQWTGDRQVQSWDAIVEDTPEGF